MMPSDRMAVVSVVSDLGFRSNRFVRLITRIRMCAILREKAFERRRERQNSRALIWPNAGACSPLVTATVPQYPVVQPTGTGTQRGALQADPASKKTAVPAFIWLLPSSGAGPTSRVRCRLAQGPSCLGGAGHGAHPSAGPHNLRQVCPVAITAVPVLVNPDTSLPFASAISLRNADPRAICITHHGPAGPLQETHLKAQCTWLAWSMAARPTPRRCTRSQQRCGPMHSPWRGRRTCWRS